MFPCNRAFTYGLIHAPDRKPNSTDLLLNQVKGKLKSHWLLKKNVSGARWQITSTHGEEMCLLSKDWIIFWEFKVNFLETCAHKLQWMTHTLQLNLIYFSYYLRGAKATLPTLSRPGVLQIIDDHTNLILSKDGEKSSNFLDWIW